MPSSFRELATRQRKNERSRFKRRQDRLFEYSDEFGKLFNSKLYLLVQSKEGRFSICENCEDFPPSRSVLELLSLAPAETEVNTKPSFEHNTRQIMEKESEERLGRCARVHFKSKFDRLKNRLLGYANNFAREFSAKVYLLIQLHCGDIIDYTSSSSKSWPPSKKQVQLFWPSVKRKGPSDFDGSPGLLAV